jgi:chaperonin GroES
MIKMLQNNVLVLPVEAEKVTKGGIYIPDTAKEKPTKGKVIAVGPGIKDEPMELKEGDVILFGKYSGTELTHEGVDYIRIRQNDAFCVIE